MPKLPLLLNKIHYSSGNDSYEISTHNSLENVLKSITDKQIPRKSPMSKLLGDFSKSSASASEAADTRSNKVRMVAPSAEERSYQEGERELLRTVAKQGA